MRKIIVLSFITLDGIMQAPGGPKEDTSGGFKYGGWIVSYFDDFLGQAMSEQMGKPFDLLLGRKTFEIFAGSITQFLWRRYLPATHGPLLVNLEGPLGSPVV